MPIWKAPSTWNARTWPRPCASFQQAVQLNPNDSDYSLALIVTRENYVTELVQRAARARAVGDTNLAESLLGQARNLDPENHEVAQHFGPASDGAVPAAKAAKGPGLFYSSIDPAKFPPQNIASTLSGPVELTPDTGKRDVHLHGDVQSVARNLYSLYGMKVSFDPSVTGGPPINLDMNNVSYAGATRALNMAAGIFAVPVQPKSVLIAKDTQENRDALTPQVEETIYLPGRTNDEMQELANLARNIFDIKEVTASATGGFILLRGNEQVLREVNAVYDDMLDGNAEVLFDVSVYEIDKTLDNNVGATLPNSAGVFSVASEAQSLVSANQSLINEAVADGLLTLNGTPLQNLITEVGFLVASGTVSAAQYTNLAGHIRRRPHAGWALPWIQFQFQPGVELFGREHTGCGTDTCREPTSGNLSRRLSLSGGYRDLQLRREQLAGVVALRTQHQRHQRQLAAQSISWQQHGICTGVPI